MKITARFDLASGIALVFPQGRLIIAIFTTDTDMDDLDLETQDEGLAWREWNLADGSGLWTPNNSVWNPFPAFIITDGVNFRILNDGIGVINNLQYVYMEI